MLVVRHFSNDVIKHTTFENRTDFEINKYKYQRG